MITHIVFFKVKEPHLAQEIKTKLEALPPLIPQIITFELGLNELESPRAFDLSLYSTFESYETMKTYQDHPEHQAVLPFIRESCSAIHSVDYTKS